MFQLNMSVFNVFLRIFPGKSIKQHFSMIFLKPSMDFPFFLRFFLGSSMIFSRFATFPRLWGIGVGTPRHRPSTWRPGFVTVEIWWNHSDFKWFLYHIWHMISIPSLYHFLYHISIFLSYDIGLLVGGFNHLEKYESQWEGLSHILWKIKFMFQTTNII